jgi:hypothetical protein
MIAKHVPMKSVKKSDFAELARYVTDEQDKNERVGYVSFTNCEAQNLDGVIAEVLATQQLNKRAESDKTYHLIVSFRAGELPDEATIRAIESRICEGLGFGEHQRMSAVHHDTDNLHLHIAINKIHPLSHTIYAPYNDHKILGQLCEKLEKEFDLEPDNHQAQKRGAENRAADMENHSGIESLLGWIKRECQTEIKGANSWAELHQVMSENGLELRERGNGFVVVSEDGTMVKASSIDRDLSKGKLEARFGPFEPSPERQTENASKPIKQYKAQPMRSRINTVELYAKYRNEQQALGVLRTSEWTKARDRKNQRIEAIKKGNRLKRTLIKNMMVGGVSKRIMYATASKAMKDEIQKINALYAKEQQAINERCQRKAWADWLKAKAAAGDQEALNALRARESAQGLKGNTIAGNRRRDPGKDPEQDNITKKGTVIYRNGVRDDGSKLKVGPGATQEGLQDALRMALDRYGTQIAVNGSAGFKEQIVQAAVTARLPITFDDAALERQRRELLRTEQETTNDRENRRRVIGGGNDGAGFAAARDSQSAGRTGRAELRPGAGIPGKPDIGKVGRKPPPESRGRLRALSELGVVRDTGRGEVLLPGNVSHYMEQQGAGGNNIVRRALSGTRVELNVGLVAADKYIAEREEKRSKIFDIPKHTRYNEAVNGGLAFAGTRQIDGQALALLENKNKEIMVLPIDTKTMNRLKRMALGDPITVTKGVIKTKGRSR